MYYISIRKLIIARDKFCFKLFQSDTCIISEDILWQVILDNLEKWLNIEKKKEFLIKKKKRKKKTRIYKIWIKYKQCEHINIFLYKYIDKRNFNKF